MNLPVAPDLAATPGATRTLLGVDEISYTVRRSARARRVRVNVHADAGVEVVLPKRAPERAAAAAVSELRPWIERRLEEAREVLARGDGGNPVPHEEEHGLLIQDLFFGRDDLGHTGLHTRLPAY